MQFKNEPQPRTTLLISSNGGGLGHLSRQVAISSAGAAAGLINPIVLTMSKGSDAVRAMGLNVEYIPSRLEQNMSFTDWHMNLASLIVERVQHYNVQAVHFDGVSIYAGLVIAAGRLPEVPFSWTRRGMWKKFSTARDVSASAIFDLIIEPADLAQVVEAVESTRGMSVTRVSPITLVDVIPRLSRQEAARAIGLDPSRKTILVAIGSGALGDNRKMTIAVRETIAGVPDWQMVFTNSPIATERSYRSENEFVLPSSYPIIQFLSVFDAAIIAAGYNAPHEMIGARIPSLVIPNIDTVVDDQMARAMGLAERQLVITATPGDYTGIVQQVQKLLRDDTIKELERKIDRLGPQEKYGGALQVATLLAILNVNRARRLHRLFWSSFMRFRLRAISLSESISRLTK